MNTITRSVFYLTFLIAILFVGTGPVRAVNDMILPEVTFENVDLEGGTVQDDISTDGSTITYNLANAPIVMVPEFVTVYLDRFSGLTLDEPTSFVLANFVNSSMDISTVLPENITFDLGTRDAEGFVLDDFALAILDSGTKLIVTYQASPTPEPTSYALIALGILSIGGSMYRRKKTVNS